MKIEVFYAEGCGSCSAPRGELKAAVLAAFPEGASWNELDILKNIDYAVDLGVLSVPAIAIDGSLAFAKLPSAQQLLGELASRAARS